MSLVPEKLPDWSEDIIRSLLKRGYHEDARFDFTNLPHTKEDKDGLAKACAAFANSAGGFLILGVGDRSDGDSLDRLLGMPAAAAADLPENFGNFPARCQPPVDWDFLNPPIRLTSGNVIHIVHIPLSWRAPHAVGNPKEGFKFPKRTNQGTEFMSYSEVQAMFLSYREKRLKLQQLRFELTRVEMDTSIRLLPDTAHGYSVFGPLLDINVLERLFVETYDLVETLPDLLNSINDLRNTIYSINRKAKITVGGRPDDEKMITLLGQQANTMSRETLRLLDRLLTTKS